LNEKEGEKMKLKELSKRKKIIGVSLIVAAVLAVGGGSVYAYNNYQEQQRIEAEQAAKEAEEKRFAEKEAAISAELNILKRLVMALYTDDTESFIKDDLIMGDFVAVEADLEFFEETYAEDADITGVQREVQAEVEDSYASAVVMFEITELYNSLYSDGQLAVPDEATITALVSMEEKLSVIREKKPAFAEQYLSKMSEAEAAINQMRDAVNAVYQIYNKDLANMTEGVTREQYAVALDAVNVVQNEALKAELQGYLSVVDKALTETDEVQKMQEETKSSASNSGSSSSGSSSSSGGSSASSGSSSSSKSNSGSSSSSGGSSDSSGGNSSGSSNSGSSSSENNSGGSSESTRIPLDYEYIGNPDGAGDVYGGGGEGSLY